MELTKLMTTNKDLVDRHGVNLNSDGYCRTSGEIQSIELNASQWYIDNPYKRESSRLVPLDSAYLTMKHRYTRLDVSGGTFEGGFAFNNRLTSTQFDTFYSNRDKLIRYKPTLDTLLYIREIPYYDVRILASIDQWITLEPSGCKYARDDMSQYLYYYGYNSIAYTQYVSLPIRSFLSTAIDVDIINLPGVFFTEAISG